MRFRRLDAYNFVIEKERVIGEKLPNGSPNPRAGEKVWEIESYHSRLDQMIRTAINTGVGGNSIKEFAQTLKETETRIMDALAEAVKSGGLSMVAYADKVAESVSKRRKTIKAKTEAPGSPEATNSERNPVSSTELTSKEEE